LIYAILHEQNTKFYEQNHECANIALIPIMPVASLLF